MSIKSAVKSCAVAAAVAVLASTLSATPARALDSGNPFTADALPTWQTNGTVWGMATAQGKVFAGGGFTQVRPPGTSEGDPASLARTNLAVLDAVTGNPTGCVLNATRGTASAIIRAVATSPDQKTVYIGGLFTQVNAENRQNVAAIDVATCKVLPFNPKPSSFVYAIAATASKVYLGGTFGNLGGQTRSRLGAANTAGDILPWAPTAEDEILALAVDPNNGNVVLGGRMDLVNGRDSHDLAVVDGVAGTTNVRSYPQPFFSYAPGDGQRSGNTAIKTIATDSTGFYIGAEGTGGGVFDGRAGFNWGSYDQRWRDNCLGATQAVVVHRGVLFAADHAHDCSSEGLFEDGARHYFTAQGTADKSFRPWWPQANAGIGEGIGPRSIAVAETPSGAYLWSGGEFTTIGGLPQRGLTRFGTAPDTGLPDTPATPNVTSTVPGQARVVWRTTQDTDDRTLTYTLYRGSSTTPIATLSAPSEFYSRPQLSFTDTGLTAGTSYSYKVRASDGSMTSAYSLSRSVTVAATNNAYPNQVRADGAAVYFRMEEASGTAAASDGSSTLGGSYVNASTRAGQEGALVGRPDTSAQFDGTSSFLRTEVRQPAPTTYSAELWFKTTTTRGGKLIGYGDRAQLNGVLTPSPLSTTFDRHVYMTNDGLLVFGTRAGGRVNTLTSSKSYNNGQWHHMVATQGSAGMGLYVDGVRVARNAVTTATSINGYWRIGGDAIGSGWPKAPTSSYLAGNIDEAAIYPTALSRTQISNHYQLSGRTPPGSPAPGDAYGAAVYDDTPELYWRLGEPSGPVAADTSDNARTGNYSPAGVTQGVVGAVSGTGDTAVTTNGSTGLVSAAGSAPSPTGFSEELWFKTGTTTGGKLIGFGNSATGQSTAYDKHLYLGNDGKLRFGVYTTTYNTITSPAPLNDNAWHHVVGTQDTGGQKLYVDGALVASNSVATNQAYDGYWRVGGDTLSAGWPSSPTSKFVNASIDEVAVYLTALTPAQVQAHRALGMS